MPDDPTIGEVYRLARDTRTDIARLDEKVDSLKEERLPARVRELETAQRWVVRLIVGTVIASVLGLVLYSGGVFGA